MDWDGFCTYLQRNYSKTTISITWAYARKYCEYVFKDDVSGLGQIEGSRRDNAIKSLSVLAKFLGRADEFKLKLKAYGIRKTQTYSSIDTFLRMMNSRSSDVLQWYGQIQEHLRSNEKLYTKFLLLSGLRKQEAIQSFNLIIRLYNKGEISNYYNAKLKALEHWKYKDLFLRRTKNAFITFIPEGLVMQIANSKPIAYTTIRKRILSHNMHKRLNELRDYFGTYMLKHGLIEHETNILQGRTPPDSILTKHYFSPSFTELRDRTLKAITELEQTLD
jgi:hypothetical protein